MDQLLYLVLAILCGVVVIKLYTGRLAPRISAEEAKARLDSGDGVTVVDVRTEEEYRSGHIPGALCLPLDSIRAQAAQILPDKEAEILVYCRSGGRSAQAARALVSLGYANVRNLGGILSWPYETTTD